MQEPAIHHALHDQAASLRFMLNPQPHLAWVVHRTEGDDVSSAMVQYMLHSSAQQNAHVLAFYAWDSGFSSTVTKLPDPVLHRRHADYLLDRILMERQQACIDLVQAASLARQRGVYGASLKRWADRAIARLNVSIWAVQEDDRDWLDDVLPLHHHCVWMVSNCASSLKDTYRGLKSLVSKDQRYRDHVQHHVVITQADSPADANKIYLNLSTTSKKYLGINLSLSGCVGLSSWGNSPLIDKNDQADSKPWWQTIQRIQHSHHALQTAQPGRF